MGGATSLLLIVLEAERLELLTPVCGVADNTSGSNPLHVRG